MASLHSHGVFIFLTAMIIMSDHALASSGDNLVDPKCISVNQSEITLKNSIKLTMNQISDISPQFAVNGALETLINSTKPSNGLAMSALSSCRDLLSLAMDNLNKSLSSSVETAEFRGNLRSWLCAASTDLQTCVDGFYEQSQMVRNHVLENLKNPIDQSLNSSTIMALIDSCSRDQDSSTLGQDDYPSWLSSEDRRLLEDSNVIANVVVAKDGSGKYKRVSDAVRDAPRLSNNRFVIYVKKGIYHENVRIDYDQWNVMIFGDGMDQTIIFSNLSYGGGVGTIDTATFSVNGQGFIARDIRFMNTAGAINLQAVALVSTADRSIFYRCSMESFQDTLYVHSNRQFYRECDIYGTIDFIFGDAFVVIQKSNIYARKPLQGQENTITAQHRTNPQCRTAIVVQSSVIEASGDLTGVSTYLGRPWTPYATVVFMQNMMGKLIDPKGWLPWDQTPGAPPPPNTTFLAEYGNTGAGAATGNRVKWGGVRTSLSAAEASRFTVRNLIQGDQWIPATQVVYDPGL